MVGGKTDRAVMLYSLVYSSDTNLKILLYSVKWIREKSKAGTSS